MGAIVEAAADEVREARDRLERHQNEKESAQSAVEQSEKRVSTIQSQIHDLQRKIGELKKQRQEYHDKVGEIKILIPHFRQSYEFLMLLKQSSEHGTHQTGLLQRIVDIAHTRGNYDMLQSRGTRRMVSTFLGAWEGMISMAIEGSSSHLLQIEFCCTHCRSQQTAMPYLDRDGDFVCFQCSSQYAIEN